MSEGDLGRPGSCPRALGRSLRALRRRKNIKQEDVADRLQVSQSYVSRLENGVIMPSPEIVERLSRLLYNPAHRPLVEQLKTIVRHGPHAVALLTLKDGAIDILEASERFRTACPAILPGDADTPRTDTMHGPIAEFVGRLVNAGAFDGEVACIEFAWRVEKQGAWQHFHSVQTPIYASDRWLIHSVTSVIGHEAYQRFLNENNGPERLHTF